MCLVLWLNGSVKCQGSTNKSSTWPKCDKCSELSSFLYVEVAFLSRDQLTSVLRRWKQTKAKSIFRQKSQICRVVHVILLLLRKVNWVYCLKCIYILLIRAGIESNPGPASGWSPSFRVISCKACKLVRSISSVRKKKGRVPTVVL